MKELFRFSKSDLHPVSELTRWTFELARRMVIRWYITLIIVACCLIASVAIGRKEGPVYITTMKVIPASAVRGDGGGVASNASFLGVSLGSSNAGGKMGLYLALLQSPVVAQALIDHYHYDKEVFGSAVDPRTGRWKPSFYSRRNDFLYHLFGITPPDRPSVTDLSGSINSMITLDQDKDPNTGATVISCRSNETKTCPKLLVMLDREAQSVINQMSLDQSRQLSTYLIQEMSRVPEVEARAALAAMLANTQREIALSSLNRHNVAAILEGPTTSASPVFPNPQTMLSLAFIMGLILSGIVTWFTWSIRFSHIQDLIGGRIRDWNYRAET
jgi:hypothetical protein